MSVDAPLNHGAQAERTALAWQRTGLAIAALGLLIVHTHGLGRLPAAWAGLLVVATGAAVATVVAPWRYVRLQRAVRSGSAPVAAAIIPATALLMVLTCAGVAVLLSLG